MNSLIARRSFVTVLLTFSLLLHMIAGVSTALAACPAKAQSETDMKPYRETLANADVAFDMVPIRGGTFLMGSPDSEPDRSANEGPRHKVRVDPFWMGRCEVTWDEYEVFMFRLDEQKRKLKNIEPTDREKKADAVTQPTKPFADMTFDMGKHDFPAICMTQHAAKQYCKWLTEKTGRYHRLPTEAEWEYACRAGTTTAYGFGDDPDQLDEYAWYVDNSEDEQGDFGYQKVGTKKPNAWGLYDMHGNVAEWVLDALDPSFYKKSAGGAADNPLCPPKQLYGRIVRGGSWDDDAELLRSAARRISDSSWKQLDPQLPQSIWYHTDALFVGFRVVRPLTEPTANEKKKYASDPIQSEF